LPKRYERKETPMEQWEVLSTKRQGREREILGKFVTLGKTNESSVCIRLGKDYGLPIAILAQTGNVFKKEQGRRTFGLAPSRRADEWRVTFCTSANTTLGKPCVVFPPGKVQASVLILRIKTTNSPPFKKGGASTSTTRHVTSSKDVKSPGAWSESETL